MTDTGSTTALADQGGIVPVFATPFAAVNTGVDRDFNARLASLCQSRRAVPGQDFLDSADSTAAELKRLILGQAAIVVAGLSSIGAEEFGKLHIQARGWCSIVPRNAHVPAQHFPGASWLAVYCVQAGEPDPGSRAAGVVRLYERRLSSIYRDASTWELQSPYRYGNYTWTPKPGWLALFPAHLRHEVSVVRSDTALILVFAMIRFVDANAKDNGYG